MTRHTRLSHQRIGCSLLASLMGLAACGGTGPEPAAVAQAGPEGGASAPPAEAAPVASEGSAPRGFHGLERAENVCLAAIARAEELLERSRNFTDERRAWTPEDLFRAQRDAVEARDIETYASCLATDGQLEYVWAGTTLIGVALIEHIREVTQGFERRFPEAQATESSSARVMASLREMLSASESTPRDVRVRQLGNALRIYDAAGNPGHAIVQRNGVWFVTDPIQRADVVRDGTRAMLRGFSTVAHLDLALEQARDLQDLDARMAPLFERVEVELAEFEALSAATASGAPSATCPQCGLSGFFAGRCQRCGLDLARGRGGPGR